MAHSKPKYIHKLTFPYEANKDKAMLIALGVIKDHSDMTMERLSILYQQFRDKNDISYDVPAKDAVPVLRLLLEMGFFVQKAL